MYDDDRDPELGGQRLQPFEAPYVVVVDALVVLLRRPYLVEHVDDDHARVFGGRNPSAKCRQGRRRQAADSRNRWSVALGSRQSLMPSSLGVAGASCDVGAPLDQLTRGGGRGQVGVLNGSATLAQAAVKLTVGGSLAKMLDALSRPASVSPTSSQRPQAVSEAERATLAEMAAALAPRSPSQRAEQRSTGELEGEPRTQARCNH